MTDFSVHYRDCNEYYNDPNYFQKNVDWSDLTGGASTDDEEWHDEDWDNEDWDDEESHGEYPYEVIEECADFCAARDELYGNPYATFGKAMNGHWDEEVWEEFTDEYRPDVCDLDDQECPIYKCFTDQTVLHDGDPSCSELMCADPCLGSFCAITLYDEESGETLITSCDCYYDGVNCDDDTTTSQDFHDWEDMMDEEFDWEDLAQCEDFCEAREMQYGTPAMVMNDIMSGMFDEEAWEEFASEYPEECSMDRDCPQYMCNTDRSELHDGSEPDCVEMVCPDPCLGQFCVMMIYDADSEQIVTTTCDCYYDEIGCEDWHATSISAFQEEWEDEEDWEDWDSEENWEDWEDDEENWEDWEDDEDWEDWDDEDDWEDEVVEDCDEELYCDFYDCAEHEMAEFDSYCWKEECSSECGHYECGLWHQDINTSEWSYEECPEVFDPEAELMAAAEFIGGFEDTFEMALQTFCPDGVCLNDVANEAELPEDVDLSALETLEDPEIKGLANTMFNDLSQSVPEADLSVLQMLTSPDSTPEDAASAVLGVLDGVLGEDNWLSGALGNFISSDENSGMERRGERDDE